MGLEKETESLYFSILHTYSYKISRLDDADSELTDEERKDKLDDIITTMDRRLSELLTKEDFKIHKSNYGYFVKMLYEKYGWDWKEE